MVPPPARPGLEDPADVAETTVLGALLGAYRYSELKTRDKPKAFGRLTLVQAPGGRPGRLRAALDGAEATAEALRLTRDLANRPANLLYPEAMAEEARRLAGRAGLKIKVLDMNAARRKGMGAFLAVAGGSARPGRIIVMEYRGAAPSEKPVALVGKAITFDSGGLNLKPVDGMGNMKTDMAGGAAVMAVILAAARLRLKINLVGVVPAAENMPGGAAYRPGDVLTTMSGQTVEVFNTDAEGRLVLADG
ncbi:MAG: aminopeptidase, partial [Proteobacteria bacterium]|nr:aminopeptidase [Pseudomonadota bacterium]